MSKLTKAQKKRLLKGIHGKAMKSFVAGSMTMNEANAVKKITDAAMRRLER